MFNVPPTAMVIWRCCHDLKYHWTDWRSRGLSRGLNLQSLVYKGDCFIIYITAAPKLTTVFDLIFKHAPISAHLLSCEPRVTVM